MLSLSERTNISSTRVDAKDKQNEGDLLFHIKSITFHIHGSFVIIRGNAVQEVYFLFPFNANYVQYCQISPLTN